MLPAIILAVLLFLPLLGWLLNTNRRLLRDAAAQAKGHQALAETERRQRLLCDQSADAIWQFDRDLTILYASDAARALTGLTRKELLGRKLEDLVTAESFSAFRQRLTGEEPFKTALDFTGRDATAGLVEIHMSMLQTGSEILGYCGVTREFVNRTDPALGEDTFRKLLEMAPFAIMLTRQREGRILYANERAARQLGLPLRDLIGVESRRFFDDPATLAEIDAVLAEGGQMIDLQTKLRRRDGEMFWAVHSSRIVDFEGAPAIFAAFSDISASKRIEVDLLQSNELLQQKLDEISTLQIQLREQAVRDGLTGLFNRRYLDETLERELARAKREHSSLALVMIDVDHFKHVNDTYGHHTGDEVLKNLARMVAQSTRMEDIVCRYGGEEFMVMLPRANAEFAQARAEQWRLTFEELSLKSGDAEVRATISLGIVSYPDQEVDAPHLLRLCDEALYEAKRGGRNRSVIYGDKDVPMVAAARF